VIDRARAALHRTAAIAVRRPGAALWTIAQLACALFIVGLSLIAAAAIDRWAAAHPGTSGAMVVYLGDGVDDARASALVGELRRLRGVERAELVPAAESAHRLSRALGTDPALLEGIDLASLPGSVEVALAPGVRDVVALSPTVRALRGTPGVADVVIEDAADDRLAGALHTARSAAWTGAGVLAALALVIALAAIRIRFERSPREARVLELLGAPPGFAAIPTALAGALHGTAAALAAVIAIAALDRGQVWIGATELVAPPALALAGLVALGAVLGLIGGGLAGVGRAQ
jgi:cell division protein FtsX